MVVLGSRAGITLAAFEEVAWRGEPVRIEASASRRRIWRATHSFA